MIIDEYVEVILNSKNIKKLIILGYNGKIKDKIKISIKDLSKYSQVRINVKCDNCGKDRNISYNNYNKQTNFNSTNYYCSDCKEIKTKKTCLDRYGVESHNSSNVVKEKLKNNNIEKYGVGNPFESTQIKEKIKKIKLDRYKNSNYNNRNKSKITCLEKYGVENPLQNNDIKNKSKKTCLDRYGAESYMNTKEFRKISTEFFKKNKIKIKEKTKNTNLEKYGVKNPFESEDIKCKIRQTCLEKYGVEHPAQNENIFLKTQKSRFKIEKYKETDIYSQGTYEKDFLENFYDKIEIKKSKSFLYVYKNKKHYYHPDYYLPKFNLIVEIKSKYIYELELDQNLLKKQACLDKGYNFIFIIDKDYTEIKNIIK